MEHMESLCVTGNQDTQPKMATTKQSPLTMPVVLGPGRETHMRTQTRYPSLKDRATLDAPHSGLHYRQVPWLGTKGWLFSFALSECSPAVSPSKYSTYPRGGEQQLGMAGHKRDAAHKPVRSGG